MGTAASCSCGGLLCSSSWPKKKEAHTPPARPMAIEPTKIEQNISPACATLAPGGG